MLRSVSVHLQPGRHVDVYVLADGASAVECLKLESALADSISIRWVQPNHAALEGLPTWGRMPVSTYHKLTLGDWLPPDVQRVVWLDCDLIVLGDLGELWDKQIGARTALAVQDQRVPLVSSRFGVAGFRDLGLSTGAKYFNAGVMLIDLAAWRGDQIGVKAREYVLNYADRVYFWDQEALNAVLAGKWGEMDLQWNWNPGLERLSGRRLAPEDLKIAHFSGAIKPWLVQGSTPLHRLYRQHLVETGWAEPASCSWSARLIEAYESSALRRLIYPGEQWAVPIWRALTRRYYSNGE